METKELTAVLTELKKLEGSLHEKLTAQADEIRKHGGTSTQTATQVGALEKKHDALEREMRDIVAEIKKNYEGLETKMNRPGFGSSRSEYKDLGSRFTESEQYKNFVQHKGVVPMQPVPIGSTFEKKDISGGTDELRSIFAFEKVQQIFADPLRPNRVRDLFPVIPTTANVIEFVIEDLYTIGAAPVAEGAQKPESTLRFADENSTVRTIAHWIPINRQLLDDVGSLRAYINLRLTEGLKEVEDVQLLYGDGTGQNLLGIMVTPGIQSYNQSSGAATDTKIDAVRRAITKAQLAYYPVTGIVMHPKDWEDIELAKGSDQHYIWVNVALGAAPMLWKVPVVATSAIAEGQALTGAFQLGAAIWDREAATIRATDSHSDFFTKNRLVILCEERLTLTTFRPKSFVKIAFDGPLS